MSFSHESGSRVYGASRASTRSYYQHHIAAIAAAIVFADVSTIHATAAHLSALLITGGEGVKGPAATVRW